MNLDLVVFNYINGFAGEWLWLDYLGIFFAKYFEYVLLFFLILSLAASWKRHWKMVASALISAIISRFIIGFLIRFLWFRQRPFVAENFIPLINQNPAEASFPSGHALFYFAVSTVIYLYNKKAGILFYIASILIVISRVFAGIHWPSDILTGALIGVLIGWLVYKIFKLYEDNFFRSWGGV